MEFDLTTYDIQKLIISVIFCDADATISQEDKTRLNDLLMRLNHMCTMKNDYTVHVEVSDRKADDGMTDAELCQFFWILHKALPKEPSADIRLWSDGDEILCRDEKTADALADLFDAVYGESVVNTGYYDPEEDARNRETDQYTGWYYCTYA